MKTKCLLPLTALTFLLVCGPDRATAVTDPFRGIKNRDTEVQGQPDPGTLGAYRNKVGQSFYFEVTGGATAGTVWGTDVYTDDSSLAMAAVHAGVLRNGQKGVVKVTMLAGEGQYTGSTRNGVTSNPYGNWGGSYRVEAAGPRVRVRVKGALGKVLADPGSLDGYRRQVGKTFLFQVTGTTTGAVWGSGTYTDDSSLATAAVHAGVLRNGQKGVVKVTILAGQGGYQGSVQNGVTTSNWGTWGGSFRVEAENKK